MTKGRKKTAPEILKLSGSYIKNPQRENKAAPKADGEEPEMPDYFSEDEKFKWGQLLEDMKRNGICSSDLREIMIAYCTAYGGWMLARKAVLKTGIVLVQKTDDGIDAKRNPFSVELHKYREEMNRLLPELGLTPSARAKMVANVPPEEDEFAQWLARSTS
jgi:P27 family predicted phage terminase small subunit